MFYFFKGTYPGNFLSVDKSESSDPVFFIFPSIFFYPASLSPFLLPQLYSFTNKYTLLPFIALPPPMYALCPSPTSYARSLSLSACFVLFPLLNIFMPSCLQLPPTQSYSHFPMTPICFYTYHSHGGHGLNRSF